MRVGPDAQTWASRRGSRPAPWSRSWRSIGPPGPSNCHVLTFGSAAGSGPWQMPGGPSGNQPSGRSRTSRAVSVAGRPSVNPHPREPGRARSCQRRMTVDGAVPSTRIAVRPSSCTSTGGAAAAASMAGVQGCSTSSPGSRRGGLDHQLRAADQQALCRLPAGKVADLKQTRWTQAGLSLVTLAGRCQAAPRTARSERPRSSVPGGKYFNKRSAGTRTRTTSRGPAPIASTGYQPENACEADGGAALARSCAANRLCVGRAGSSRCAVPR